jgi:hypothetical protein
MITEFHVTRVFWKQQTSSSSILRNKRRHELNNTNYSELTYRDIVYPLPICVFKIANRKSGSLCFCVTSINRWNRRWLPRGPVTKTTMFAAQRRFKRCRRSGWKKKYFFFNVFLYEIQIRKQQVTKIRRRRLNRRINRRRSPSCLRLGLSNA